MNVPYYGTRWVSDGVPRGLLNFGGCGNADGVVQVRDITRLCQSEVRQIGGYDGLIHERAQAQ